MCLSYFRMSFAKLLDLGNIICRERRHDLFTHKLHIVSQHDCSAKNQEVDLRTWPSNPIISLNIHTPEGPRGEATLFRRQATVDPYNLHTVTWFHPVNEVIIGDDVDRSRQLSCRGFLRHLLNGQRLVVLIAAQPELRLQRIVFFILQMQDLFWFLRHHNTKSVVIMAWPFTVIWSTSSWINIHVSMIRMGYRSN